MNSFNVLYNQYFHFTELPFSIAPDPHFMYMSARHQEGLAHLLYGITIGGGFVSLTGEVGTGKTTLCHCLLQELPKNIDIALILNPKLNAIELLATICDELGISYNKNQPSLKTLVDALNQHLINAHANGRRTVLLIDEAQNLSMEVLEQIRLLTNLETSKTKLLQIILVGQPELKQLLKRQELRQLNQRITARYHLLPLSFAETRAYIRHRLLVCNGNPELFKNNAIRKIYKLSSGIPRIINILCDRALLGAYANDVRVITPKIIQVAARETLASADQHRRRLIFSLALLLSCGLIAGGYYVYHLRVRPDVKASINAVEKQSELAAKPEPVMRTQAAKPEVQAKSEAAAVAEPLKFDAWLLNPELTLNAGLTNALLLLGHTPPATGLIECDSLTAQGINCLFGRGGWKDLLSINRPAILEFTLADGAKRWALMTGFRQNQQILHINQDLAFPLADVLSYWSGNYLIPWISPIADVKMIYPGQSSDQVLWLRQQLAVFDGIDTPVKQPRFFDQALTIRVKNFQRQHNLFEDGKAGLQTLFHLDNQSGSTTAPRLITTD